MKVVYCTGYKGFELGIFQKDHDAVRYIKKAFEKELRLLLDEGLEWVLSSGQIGVELWALEAAISLRQEFPTLKVGVIEPFQGQSQKWNEANQNWYNEVIGNLDYVNSLYHQPYKGPYMFRRHQEFIIHKSDGALILYDPEREGTPKYFYEAAINFQLQHPYDVRTISFYDLQLVVEQENEEF
ncbi:MAG TPA: DUF1273 domain-containing protein [Bacillus sp. (in: firmicutes)]|uniref:DUF1273 domain-containing protein n=1 Tax=Bacillus litorisediminis TaxID=2922713 RepID=UPI001FABAED9|nr:DUF1273 domain-containing protein [Bacillus litorisediminis]HWO76349.1 DUF1273 domain-containing protein [Bacillus sp. (in: firmicutes)]